MIFEPSKNGRRAQTWTYKSLWDAEQTKLTEVREWQWRIVVTSFVVTGITQSMGEVDERGSHEVIAIAIASSMTCPLNKLRTKSAADLGFYQDIFDAAAQGYDNYSAELQVRFDGKWVRLKSIKPIEESFDEPDWPDDGGEDDDVSPGTVYSRALRHSGGNHERAREAAWLYPGDYI